MPGPATRLKRPKRMTTARSHSMTMCTDEAARAPDHHSDHEGGKADAAGKQLGTGEHERAGGSEHDDGESHGAVAGGAPTPRFQPRARLRHPPLRARGT